MHCGLNGAVLDIFSKKYILHSFFSHPIFCTYLVLHLGSENLVVDLVHPSLYCYVKGVTEIIQSDNVPTPDYVFQWLPSEFLVERNNGEVGIDFRPYILFILLCDQWSIASTVGDPYYM